MTTLTQQLIQLIKYLPYRLKVGSITLIVLTFSAGVLDALSVAVSIPFFSLLINTGDAELGSLPLYDYSARLGLNGLPFYALLFISLALLSGISRTLLICSQNRYSQSLGHFMACASFMNALHDDYEVHVKRSSSEVIGLIQNKVNDVMYDVILAGLSFFSSLFITSMIVFTLLKIDFYGTLEALLFVGGVYSFIFAVNKYRFVGSANALSETRNVSVKSIQEGLGGIRDLILSDTYNYIIDVFSKNDLKMRKIQGDLRIASNVPRYIVESSILAVFGGLVFLSSQFHEGVSSLNLPFLVALVLAAQRILPNVQLMYSSLTNGIAAKTMLGDVLCYLKPRNKSSTVYDSPSFSRSIVLDHVYFKYQETEILRDVNLEVLKGSVIGIVGKTGSGKSTLADILMGLLLPSDGQISIDGVLLNSNNVNYLRSLVAHVPQNIFLTDSSIISNIALGVEEDLVDINRVMQCLSIAELDSYVESLENGIYSSVGENGVGLSGGQRQRIGIARALYMGKQILVLDEATSALDPETESKVMNNIHAYLEGVTVVMIAHRLSTLKKCSHVIMVESGQCKVINYSEYNVSST